MNGLLAVALGLFATLFPLVHPDASTGYRGFAFTTVGITAISLAIRATQLRREGRATSRLLPTIGGTLGVAGTLLSIWSLAFFYAPNIVPPMPSLASLTALTQPVVAAPGISTQAVPAATAPKVVPDSLATTPLATAPRSPDETRAAMQLAAGTISFVLKDLRTPGQPWPTALLVNADNMVSTPEGHALHQIPVGTTGGYARSISGENYRLTITDDSSGAGVTFDSATGLVTNN
ncbi:hypothetical protein [Cryobacterium sp. Y57]|uniref:hypothetical protein n=1 Tax=Cryobacterium sp. Y57 TaxID=2048287 RepID=UPI000CE4C3A7|nr:hypothetical protein [Cryobacterium sp. Y57]